MAAPEAFRVIKRLFHFTDAKNLPFIRQRGGLWSLAALRRNGWTIPTPGGNQWSHDEDRRRGLDRYVHLCFRASHPMEYRARQDGRIETSRFLAIDAVILGMQGVLFAPEVANKSGVTACTLQQAASMIDFEVLTTRTDWKDPGIQERLVRASKYEILVPDHVPLSLIGNMPDG